MEDNTEKDTLLRMFIAIKTNPCLTPEEYQNQTFSQRIDNKYSEKDNGAEVEENRLPIAEQKAYSVSSSAKYDEELLPDVPNSLQAPSRRPDCSIYKALARFAH